MADAPSADAPALFCSGCAHLNRNRTRCKAGKLFGPIALVTDCSHHTAGKRHPDRAPGPESIMLTTAGDAPAQES